MTISKNFKESILTNSKVDSFSHTFYNYPARFSPEFVKAAILEFTDENQLVYDPFVGGGTSLVEAALLGRESIGTDINSLACFVSKSKTILLSNSDIDNVNTWLNQVDNHTPLRLNEYDEYYLRNMGNNDTWRIRNEVLSYLNNLDLLSNSKQERIARMILLKTTQWALDNKKHIPSIAEFRKGLNKYANSILSGAKDYSNAVANMKLNGNKYYKPIIHNLSADKIRKINKFKHKAPTLILTSPPYPGVHILYHRWQISGRKETPFPYLIANSADGQGNIYYNMGHRKENELKSYFNSIQQCFSAIKDIMDQNTIIVQMLSFNSPDWQLPKYLDTLNKCGLEEIKFSRNRLWREVPQRKWYCYGKEDMASSKEVVLFHKLMK